MKRHIKIKDKVYFVPKGFRKPVWRDYENHPSATYLYAKALKEHEASKKTIEISNVYFGEISELWRFTSFHYPLLEKIVIHNQPCEAEVTDTAIITKLS